LGIERLVLIGSVPVGQPAGPLPEAEPGAEASIANGGGPLGTERTLAGRASDPALCPLPGCETPANPRFSTGACSGAHAAKLAAAARARISAATTGPRPTSKKQQLAEQQRRTEHRGRLEQALQEREARVLAAYRAHRLDSPDELG
jgi:hypothetical protein